MQVAIEKGATTGAKVRFWVFDASAEGELAHTSTQVVKLTLQPRIGESRESPFVSGRKEQGED
jgi:hypothetical protein